MYCFSGKTFNSVSNYNFGLCMKLFIEICYYFSRAENSSMLLIFYKQHTITYTYHFNISIGYFHSDPIFLSNLEIRITYYKKFASY